MLLSLIHSFALSLSRAGRSAERTQLRTVY